LAGSLVYFSIKTHLDESIPQWIIEDLETYCNKGKKKDMLKQKAAYRETNLESQLCELKTIYFKPEIVEIINGSFSILFLFCCGREPVMESITMSLFFSFLCLCFMHAICNA